MRQLLWRVVAASIALPALLSLVIALVFTVFGTRSTEAAFASDRDGNWEIYVIDFAVGVRHNLTQSSTDELDPAWSPDGSRIAFSADRDGDGQPEIHIMDANGGQPERVSTGRGGYRSPSWSRDGRSLVFTLGFGQIYVMDADGSNERRLGSGFLPSLSPDGETLLYSAESTSTIDADIYVSDMATRRVTDLTNNPANEWGARWSPDGTLIAFSSLRGGKTSVYVMNADGSGAHVASQRGTNDLSPAWSPDGTQILFTSDTEGRKQLYIVDADGSNQRRITHDDSNHQAPTWRP